MNTSSPLAVAAAAAALTSQLSALVVTDPAGSVDTSALAAAQTSALANLGTSSGGATASPADTAAAASLILAVLTVAPGVALSPAVQTAALNALASVANGAIDISNPQASMDVVNSLSSIAGSATGGGGGGAAANTAALALVGNVLNNLADSQVKALAAAPLPAPGAPPLTISTSSPTIQTTVALSAGPPVGALSAPGSPSSFNALPTSLFASSSHSGGADRCAGRGAVACCPDRRPERASICG